MGETVNTSSSPGWFYDSTSVLSRAAVAAVLLGREVKVSGSSVNDLGAWDILELLCESTVSIVVSVFSVNSVSLSCSIIIELSVSVEASNNWISVDFVEILMENWGPLWRKGFRKHKGSQ